MYYIIYKTTNNINGKIYIGMHQTDDKFDSYLGSGLALKRAIKKYGKESFSKEILFECSSYDEMVEKEKEIITKDFCLREDTYNLGPGGKGGLIWIENPMKGKKQSEKQKYSARESMIKMNSDPDVIAKRNLNYKNGMLGKHHSEETKIKMSGPRKKYNVNKTGIKRGPYKPKDKS